MVTKLEERLRNLTAVILERFEEQLDRVMENIADVNTKPDAVREITLKVKIKPTNDRSAATVEIGGSPKLAAVAPFPLTVYIGKHGGKLLAFEGNVNQGDLFGPEVDRETGEVKERGLRVV